MCFILYLYCPGGIFCFHCKRQIHSRISSNKGFYYLDPCVIVQKPQNLKPQGGFRSGDWIWEVFLGPQQLKGLQQQGQKRSSICVVHQRLFLCFLSPCVTSGQPLSRFPVYIPERGGIILAQLMSCFSFSSLCQSQQHPTVEAQVRCTQSRRKSRHWGERALVMG